MIQPRLFLCNGAINSGTSDRKELELNTQGSNPNVNIRLENVTDIFFRPLSPRIIDLIEIASYVFAADCATSRGKAWVGDQESWERDFQFIIGVRESDFWSRDEVKQKLIKVLNFLSDDKYSFEFQKLTNKTTEQLYLELNGPKNWVSQNVNRVLMFSGGLDSLAGAVETASSGENLVLVSHRSVATMDKRVKQLVERLRLLYPEIQIIHIPIWVNKDSKTLGHEHTQRTRSFLFSALGTAVAECIDSDDVRFFENGIVSLNLPVADEAIRARASRTTHPLALHLFTELYSLITGRDFKIDNPFFFKTKTDVVSIIAQNNASELISSTCSCAHQIYKSKTQWHCGTCSQCIDRRIAIFAANQEQYDLETDYVSDVFIGKRKDGYEKNMAVNYARHAFELERMNEQEIASRFNKDISRTIRNFPKRSEAAQQIIEMHKKHGKSVSDVLQRQIKNNSISLFHGLLEKSSMIAMIAGQQHLSSSWESYIQKITEVLKNGIPTACKTHKPKDEPHLQEICDGILQGHDLTLVREFPFMRWSSSLTKPDWSAEDLQLWIELKYVRKKEDIRPITKDIAEDITKYGDNNRRVLYIVYDPQHLIVNESQFTNDIIKREYMKVEFIR
jgi:7-cyano-7-deazaguanine synthase in queuosine biosynthesis